MITFSLVRPTHVGTCVRNLTCSGYRFGIVLIPCVAFKMQRSKASLFSTLPGNQISRVPHIQNPRLLKCGALGGHARFKDQKGDD